MPDIDVNPKTDSFFIAICRTGNHSFVALGVMKNNAPIILARVGKQGNQGQLADEKLHLLGNISYIAYSIRYEQYLEFIELLRLASVRQKKQHRCYQPVGEREPNSFMLKLSLQLIDTTCSNISEKPSRNKAETVIKRASSLTLCNTCRHTAIDLIKYTQNTSDAANHISSLFFYDLLLKNYFPKNKAPKHPFYIFPAPPEAYKTNQETKVILIKIYTRMHHLLKKYPYGKKTLAKFKALEALYKERAGSPTDDLNALLDSIKAWKKSNLDVIKPLRQPCLFGKLVNFFNVKYKSSTEIMVDEMEASIALALFSNKT